MASRHWWRAVALVLAAVTIGCSGSETTEQAVEGPPTVRATPVGQTVVRVAWPASLAQDAVAYRIERREDLTGDFTELASVEIQAGDTVVYLDTTVEPERYYGYRVRGVNRFGDVSAPSTVGGARTPSRPGIQVVISTTAPTTEAGDPDGYTVRVEGPDTASAITATSAQFRPLKPGSYTVTLEGIASQCSVPAGAIRTVEVTDQGLETLRRVEFGVTCRDPSRGDVLVRVVLARGADADGFGLTFTGRADQANVPDSVVFAQDSVPGGGGSASFSGVLPGDYQVELDRVDPNCTVDGPLTRPVRVEALAVDTVTYSVSCGNTSGPRGDYRPPNAAKPYKLRYRWSPATAAVGEQVQLIITADLSGDTPFQLNAVTAEIRYDSLGLRTPTTNAIQGSGTWNATSSASRGRLGFVLVTTTVPSGSIFEMARVNFTVQGAPGEELVTTTTLTEVADFSGNADPYTAKTEVLLEAPLTIGGSGGGTNQPPTAVIGGGATLSGTVGVPLSLSGTGSSDPDGTIVSYQWTLTGGTPSSATGATTSVTYATAGSYTVQLTVTDNKGATASASKQVQVTTSGGGTNQPPTAVIGGGATLSGTVGVPLSLSGSGSSDPDGTIVSYQWTLTGGTPSSATGATTSVTYATAGSYTVQLTVTDNRGATATASKPVQVTTSGGGTNQPPTAVIAGSPLTATAGSPVTLQSTGSSDPDGSIVSYQWTLTGGSPASGTGASTTTTYATAGTYTVQLTVTDNGGLTGTASTTITVAGGGGGSQPLVLRGTFGAQSGDQVRMALTLDLTTNVPETPGTEALKSFVIDSVAWNPAVLELVAVEFPSNLSGSYATNPSFPGRVGINGRFVGDGPGGVVPMGTIVFRVRSAATTTARIAVRSLISTPANNDFNYVPLTRTVDGTFPASGGLRAR